MRAILLICLFTFTTHAYMHSNYEKQRCEMLKKLPEEALSFYREFNDTKATLLLFHDMPRNNKPSCLSEKTFHSLIKNYAFILSKSHDTKTLKSLLDKYPKKIFLLQYLADVYKQKSTKKDNTNKYKDRSLAVETYQRYINQGGNVTKDIHTFIETKGLSKAKAPWGKEFTLGTIPTNQYKVFYFNKKNPKKPFKTDTVLYPAVNYEHDYFPEHKIDSNDFGAYWIGDFVFKENENMILSFEVSWSEFRLIIDGYEVAKSVNSDAHVPFYFSKGTHRIEIEYLNNYGATDFMMSMHKPYTFVEHNKIKDLLPKDYELLYVGKYEVETFDKSQVIEIKKQYSKPLVLILNSYGNIFWKIKTNNNKIDAIFVNSYHKASMIELLDTNENKIPIYHTNKLNISRSLRIKCSCNQSKSVNCEGSEVTKANEQIYSIFGKYLDGFTTFYPKDRLKNKPILVPEVYLDSQMINTIQEEEAKAKKIERECRQKRSLGIDNIF